MLETNFLLLEATSAVKRDVPFLSLILPARNEAVIIRDTLGTVTEFLDGLGCGYEILVGDSASSDGTGGLVRKMGLEWVRVVRDPLPGKGRILTRCFQEARGHIAGFIDADLEIPVTTLGPLLDAVAAGADAAIAVKTAGVDRHRSVGRRLMTRSFNAAVSVLLGSSLPDHQAGCKLFRASVLRPVLPEVRSTGWLWDTEVLVRLKRRGASVALFPCELGPTRPSGIRPGSLLGAARDLLMLSVRMRRVPDRSFPEAPALVDAHLVDD